MRYTAYGLAIDAGFPVPRLRPATHAGPTDLTLALVSSGAPSLPPPSTDRAWYRLADTDDASRVAILRTSDGRYRMRFADGTECLVDPAGTEVGAVLPPSASLDDLAVYLTGPVMGFVLRLRGRLALHASVAVLDGRAVAFAGPAGCGKSSTAAALVLRGGSLLAEDIAALDLTGSRPAVLPGHPHIGLWPDSVTALFGASAALPPIAAGWDKRVFVPPAPGGFTDRAMPLAAVYLLSATVVPGGPAVRVIPPGEAVMRLVSNVYGNLILHERLRVAELDAAQWMASALPVRELVRGAGTLDASALWDAVTADLARSRGAAAHTEPADVQHR